MEHFRFYLQQEFGRRMGANPRYSLRAFAQSLGVNHATLSSLLAGKRKITERSAKKIASRMGVSPEEERRLLGQEEAISTPYFVLQQDAFSAISEWHFDAILELSRLPIKLTPPVIAAALEIPEIQAKIALEILARLGLIEEKGGSWRLVHENSTNILDPNLTSAAQRKYQLSILKKSMEAVETVSYTERDHSSVTMAVRRADMPKAKELLKKFRQEFSALLQAEGPPDEVYQLQLGFFPLSHLKKRRDL